MSAGRAPGEDAPALLGHATALLARAEPTTAGIWPRASALLARQALEAVLDDLWRLRAPGLERQPMRAQLICLRHCLPERPDLAPRVYYAWSGLSRASHQHAYELPPTSVELAGWIEVVEELGRVVKDLGIRFGEKR